MTDKRRGNAWGLRRVLVKLSSEARVERLEARLKRALGVGRKAQHLADRLLLWGAEEEPKVQGSTIIWRSKYGPRRHNLKLADPARVPHLWWDSVDNARRPHVMTIGVDPDCLRFIGEHRAVSLAAAEAEYRQKPAGLVIMSAKVASAAEGLDVLDSFRHQGSATLVWLEQAEDLGEANWPNWVRFVSSESLHLPAAVEEKVAGAYYALGPAQGEILPRSPQSIAVVHRMTARSSNGAEVEAGGGLVERLLTDGKLRPAHYVVVSDRGSQRVDEASTLARAWLEGAIVCSCRGGALENDAIFGGSPRVVYESEAELAELLVSLSELDVLKLVHQGARFARRNLTQAAALDRLSFLTGLPSMKVRRPHVSVICVSNRVDRIPGILDTFSRFMYDNKELIVVLNVEKWSQVGLESARQANPQVTFLRTTETMSLGESLNFARRVAVGELWTKMDDDDFYGPEYLADLVDALVLSEADVVGKGTFFTYLEGVGELHLRRETQALAPSERFVHGGTILARTTSTSGIEFRPVQRGTDSLFLQDCALKGLRIFAADCLNFAYVRYAKAGHHTYDVGRDEALANSHLVASSPSADVVQA